MKEGNKMIIELENIEQLEQIENKKRTEAVFVDSIKNYNVYIMSYVNSEIELHVKK